MKANIRSIKSLKTKRKNLLKAKAFSSHCSPASLESIGEYQDKGYLSIEIFQDKIGKLFPLVLSLVNSGESIRSIERLMGMNVRSLELFLQTNIRFDKAVKEARKIRRDSIELSKMLE